MKKSKIAIGLLTGLLGVGALAACGKGPEYNPNGVILTYKVNGKEEKYTANDLFGELVVSSEHAEEMFNQVYNLVVRNYFTIENPDGEGTNTGSKQNAEIERLAKKDVKIDKDTAEKNSKTNGTNAKKEFEAILQEKGCKDEKELEKYYIFEHQKSTFKDNFYKIYNDEINTKFERGFNLLRDGSSSDSEESGKKYAGYLETKVPYHISHILVKLDDSGSSNFWDGTISAANADKLYKVVKALEDTKKSFGSVAESYSDDGSKADYGDLGIVDKDKATEEADKYVKEFILGLYSYDNLYNGDNTVRARVAMSNIAHTEGLPTKPNYLKASDFEEIYKDREVEGSDLIGTTSANFYPRNIAYNQTINNHGLSLIVGDSAEGNYKEMTIMENDTPVTKYVLCARDTKNPILVTRAGASSYQGIHFIVVNRDPFEGTLAEGAQDVMRNYTVNGVKLSDYYTTKYPGQADYPKDASGKELQTYVNPLDSLKDKYQGRAGIVLEEIKTFDTDIERSIYQKYMDVANVKIEFVGEGKKVESTINKWIARKAQEKTNSTHDSWEEYWQEYVDMLDRQDEQREKRLPKGCALAFKKASKAKTQSELDGMSFTVDDKTGSFKQLFNEIGGICNDGKSYK